MLIRLDTPNVFRTSVLTARAPGSAVWGSWVPLVGLGEDGLDPRCLLPARGREVQVSGVGCQGRGG